MTIVIIGEFQLLTKSHPAKVPGKVCARCQSKIQRAPEFGIDLDELEFSVARVAAELHHGNSMPRHRVQQAPPIDLELRVIEALCAGADSTTRRIFAYPAMHEDALAHTVLVESKKSTAIPRDELL